MGLSEDIARSRSVAVARQEDEPLRAGRNPAVLRAVDRSARSARESSSKDIVAPVFERWWAEARRELKDWNTNEFVTVPTVASALRPGPKGDRWFIDGWLERFLAAPSAKALLEDVQARSLLKEGDQNQASQGTAQTC